MRFVNCVVPVDHDQHLLERRNLELRVRPRRQKLQRYPAFLQVLQRDRLIPLLCVDRPAVIHRAEQIIAMRVSREKLHLILLLFKLLRCSGSLFSGRLFLLYDMLYSTICLLTQTRYAIALRLHDMRRLPHDMISIPVLCRAYRSEGISYSEGVYRESRRD